MTLNALNQNNIKSTFNLNSYMTSMLGLSFGNNSNKNLYYSQKGEPTYQKDMDSDNDGVVTFDYCKDNNISSKQMAQMLKNRMAYQLANKTLNSNETEDEKAVGSLDLIYATDGDSNFDEKMDYNSDSRISYSEYLRYCEQNAKTEEKRSDTKIKEDEKSRFMTSSFGKASNAYNKCENEAPQGKIEGEA